MKNREILFEGRRYRGETSPPATLEDASRYGNDGVFTNTPLWTRLPSGLWYIDFVAATSQLVTIGDIGSARTIVFWMNLDDPTDSILEEQAATGISISIGIMAYPSWDNCFIDSIDTDIIIPMANRWRHIAITSTTLVTMSAFRLGLINVTYLDGGICPPVVFEYELSQGEIQEHFEATRRLFGV